MTSCIYVAQGDRLLKVGKTNSVKSRKAALKTEFAKWGDSITSFQEFQVAGGLYAAEMQLIRLTGEVRKPFSGREWFESGDFDEVVEFARSAVVYASSFNYKTPKPLSKAKQIAIDAERKLKLETEKIRRAEWVIKSKADKAARKFLRTLRRIEVECSAMWDPKTNQKAA